MPIDSTDLRFHKSQNVSDADTNGGRMSASEVASGAVSNLFQAIGSSERASGSVKYRKLFLKNANADGLALVSPKVFLDAYTPGDDIVTFFAGDQVNVQGDVDGPPSKEYGAGKLDQNVSIGATALEVLVEDGANHTFEEGDTIRISDMADVSSLSGSQEYVTIDSPPSVLGDVVSFDITPALANGYAASNTRVMNVYAPGDLYTSGELKAEVEAVVVASGATGTFDDAYLLGDNAGGIEEDWTVTFTSTTAFGIVGANVGSVGSGTVGSGAAPNNPDYGEPYFTIQAAGFGGTFQAGDTITFTTHPSAIPVWLKRVTPAGAAALSVNTAVIAIDGETSG